MRIARRVNFFLGFCSLSRARIGQGQSIAQPIHGGVRHIRKWAVLHSLKHCLTPFRESVFVTLSVGHLAHQATKTLNACLTNRRLAVQIRWRVRSAPPLVNRTGPRGCDLFLPHRVYGLSALRRPERATVQDDKPRATRARIPAEPPKSEYDQRLWRCRSPTRASTATPIGAALCRPLLHCLLSSNFGRDTCSSRQRCMPPRSSSASGASRTGIESTSQNGCLRSGVLP